MTRRVNKLSLAMLLGSLLVLSLSAAASTWTAVASACTINPYFYPLGKYAVDNATLTFSGSSTGIVVAECNVTSPSNDTPTPAWTRLTMGYSDPDGSPGATYYVYAYLYKIDKTAACLGCRWLVTQVGGSYSGTFSEPIDFARYAYYVQILMSRGNTAANPSAWYVALAP